MVRCLLCQPAASEGRSMPPSIYHKRLWALLHLCILAAVEASNVLAPGRHWLRPLRSPSDAVGPLRGPDEQMRCGVDHSETSCAPELTVARARWMYCSSESSLARWFAPLRPTVGCLCIDGDRWPRRRRRARSGSKPTLIADTHESRARESF